MKSQIDLKIGHIGSKNKSLGQILDKPCVRSRDNFIALIPMKLKQNICLDKISNLFENASCRSNTRQLGQILEKPGVRSRGHIFSPILMKFGQNVCLGEILNELKWVTFD